MVFSNYVQDYLKRFRVLYTSYGSTRTRTRALLYVYFRRKYEDKYGNNIDNFYVYMYTYT